MSFSLIPPEINSALMYQGAGSGPLLEAATAWDGLAADLEATATQYQTAITNLTTGTWLGPSSAHMAAAAEPYIAWLQSTAAEAAQTGAQAKAAAGAYQTAYASMVPPPVITANRAELTTLVSNNFLGQNTGAIAQNEAEYLDMWIQDALGMDTYNLNSTGASAALPAQTAAPLVTSGSQALPRRPPRRPTAPRDRSSSATLNAVADLFGARRRDAALTALGRALAPGSPTVVSAVAAQPDCRAAAGAGHVLHGHVGQHARSYVHELGRRRRQRRRRRRAGRHEGLAAGKRLQMVDGKAATVMTGVGGQLSKWGAGIQAGIQAQMANAMHAGGLSVPHGWHTGVPDMSRAAPLLPTNSVASPSMTTGLPTSPFSQGLMGALAGRGMSAMGSKVAAKVMPRSPAGG